MLKKKEKLEKQKEENKEVENKIGIKEKIKRFLKNKKAVAMLMEYIITIECFAMLFLLIAPEEVKAATSTADENGITWAYTLSNGQATNVYYESGTLGETVEIPATISDGTNEYPVVSLYNSSGYSRNIFTKTNQGTDKTVKKVIIPEGVTSIGKYAFYRCSSLTSVVIPEGVASIEDNAFEGCSSLTSIEIPSSVTNIGFLPFTRCSSLTSLKVDQNNANYSSENNILYNKDKTKLIYCIEGKIGEVNIPSSVTTIGGFAFYQCSSLSSVVIPEGVTRIENAAFYYCSSLTSVNIPEGVTSIGSRAFSDCSSLTSVEIPSSVTSIGSYAFMYCSSLTSITVDEKNPYYSSENNILYNKDKTKLIYCIEGKIGEVNIPSSVTSIESYAFAFCSSLTSVEVPSSVMSIGYGAFEYCSSLTSIEIPSSVTSIGYMAFDRCSSLTSVEIPSSVTSIGNNAFSNCRSLTDIYIDNIESNITFGSNWNTYTYAYIHYRDCKHSITQTIAEAGLQIEEISNNLQERQIACGQTYQFKVVNEFGETVTNTKVKVRSQGKFTNLGEVTEEIKVNEDGIYTIENIERNKTIEIGFINGGNYQCTDENGITWNYTYQNGQATNVYYESGELRETVIIPSALDGYPVVSLYNGSGSYRNIFTKTNYGTNATVKKVIIPDSVTKIGSYAFAYCISLTDMYIDNIQSNITFGQNWKYNTYANVHYNDCKHTVTISNDPREKVEFEEITHNLEDGKIVCGESYSFKLVNEQGEVVIDKEVKIKSQGQFTNNSDITEIITPNEEGIYTIENIERNKKIIIGMENGETVQYTDENGITWEYKYEDGKARALKYISGEIPETLEVPAIIDGLVVTTIANNSLAGTSVKNVILPDSIINIGDNAFYNCIELETILLPEGLQLISNYAFEGCTNLRQVELPDDLLVIGNEAFDGCTNLTMDLNFKNGIRVIGQEAFRNCSSLKGKLTLPESIIQLGRGAFRNCTEITKVEILSYTGEKEIDQAQVNLISSPWVGNVYINESVSKDSYSNMTGIYENTVTNNVIDENGNNITESFTITRREISIGLEAFSGCTSLTQIYLPAGTNKVAYSTIDGCDNLRDIYIATKKSDMLEEVNTNGEVKVHYLDCSHTVEVMHIEGTSIEVISGGAEDGLAACQGEYKFKVNIEEGSTLKGVVVKVGNKGEEKEAIKADENGIYTIENVTKDKEISIEEGRIVEVRYEDKEGNQIAKSSILVGEEGENYKAERKEIANYRAYGEEPENKEGTFTKEEIVVTYKYEKIPSGTITIKYQDKEGNDIIDPETKQGYVGDEYEFARKNIRGYKAYGVTPEKAKGIYTEEDIEIIFVYEEIKEEETVIKYIDKDGNYIARDKTIQEGEEASTEAKEIDGYESVEKSEEGKEITYTYEKADKTGQANKWTTEKTLMAIAGVIAILIVMFIIIAKREKEE